jgi:hypothetical protein
MITPNDVLAEQHQNHQRKSGLTRTVPRWDFIDQQGSRITTAVYRAQF